MSAAAFRPPLSMSCSRCSRSPEHRPSKPAKCARIRLVTGRVLDVSVARELRDALDQAGYRPAELTRLLRGSGAGLVGRRPPLRLLRLEARQDPLAALVRLLVMAEPVAAERLSVPAALLERAGLAQSREGAVRPLAVLLPHGNFLLASDLPGAG